MSVKKIGKAILSSYCYDSPRWGVIGGSYSFGPDNIATSEKYIVKTALGDRPPRPYARSGPKYDKYKEWNDAWDVRKNEFIQNAAKEIETESSQHPVRFRLFKSSVGREASDVIYCMCRGNIYKFDRPGYSDEEMLFQIIELEDKERQKFERLKNKFSLAKEEEKEPRKRIPIPEEVRIAVWRRDEGKCVKCGSRERLEYDHIIPLSKGGSDTVRNIELLCEACNREKCAEIR